MNLYEIEAEIYNCFDEETGEIVDETKFNELNMERDKKVEGWLLYIKNLKAEEEAVKNEKLNLASRQQTLGKKIENAENFISNYLQGEQFSTARVKVSYRKSEKLNIRDEFVTIPEEFLEVEYKVKKADLKRAVKAGLEVDGVTIETKNNIQIR